jgi:hypothetical protein
MAKLASFGTRGDLGWTGLGVSLLTLSLLACNGNDPPKPWPGMPDAPLISTLTPLDGATAVALNATPSVTFNMAMAPLGTTTFTLTQGTSQVAGAVTNSSDGLTATFAPVNPLAAGTVFTATVTTGAMSAAGANLAASRSWSFTTASAIVAPVVSAMTPLANATGVAFTAPVTATFSKAMDPLTVTAATFTLKQGTSVLPATVVNGPGNLATLTPSNPLTPSTLYTATLSTAVKDLSGTPLATAVTWNFTTSAAADTTPPTVSSATPVANAVNVPMTTKLVATFSEAIDPLTLTTATFTLANGATAVPGALAVTATTATFTPTAILAASTAYTATLTNKIKDVAGNALATAYTWNFTTAAVLDTTPPTVTTTLPAANAVGVDAHATLVATFSEAMDPLTLTASTFTMAQGTTPVLGALTFGLAGTTATFTPTNALASNTLYTATVTSGAKDVAGNALAAPFTWTFTTALVDTTPPTITSTNPAAVGTNVPLNALVTATFSEAMAPLTLTTSTFTLKQGTTAVIGTVTYGPGTTATFTPTSALTASTLYTATLTSGAKDMAGNAMMMPFIWTFTTGATAAQGPAMVNLGTAGNFAILAQTGISTVPGSAITGNIGLSPAAATFITGFSLTADATNVFATSTQIVGQAFAANYAVPTPSNLTTAVSNMQTAYTDAAGRPTPDHLNLGSGNIGGLTLAPGLYNWTSTVTIPSDVVINGGANDVWIFQTSGDLSMSNAKNITLSGGAQAKNIFWQVAGQVTIGTGAHFEGIILCQTQVTLQTLATMNGRILAQSMVALQQATVKIP